jgi:uncharacterized protein YecT (DUF1311 family)
MGLKMIIKNSINRPAFMLLIFLTLISRCQLTLATDCTNSSGGLGLNSANESLDCANVELKKYDSEMNLIYRKLLGKLKNDPTMENFSRTQITYAQRAWLAFRDSECDFTVSLGGGAHQWKEVNQVECLTQFTKDRTNKLNDYINQIDNN